MNKFFKIFASLILIISGVAFVITVLLFLGKTGISFKIDTQILDHFGSFSGGLFGSLLTFSSTLFLIYSINKQQEEINEINVKEERKEFENKLFQMLEIHRETTKNNEFNYYQFTYEYNTQYNGLFKYIIYEYNCYLENKTTKEVLIQNYAYYISFNISSFEKISHDIHLIFSLFDDKYRIENYFDFLSLYLYKNEFTIVYFFSLYIKDMLQDESNTNLGSLEEFYYNIFKEKDFAKHYIKDNYLNILLEKRSLF